MHSSRKLTTRALNYQFGFLRQTTRFGVGRWMSQLSTNSAELQSFLKLNDIRSNTRNSLGAVEQKTLVETVSKCLDILEKELHSKNSCSIAELKQMCQKNVFGCLAALRVVSNLRDLSRLGVLDSIPRDKAQSISSDEIAKKLHFNSDALYRSLRLISSLGWTCEHDNREFSHTDQSLQYISESPLQTRLLFHTHSMGFDIEQGLKTGQSKPFYEYCVANHPDFKKLFGQLMEVVTKDALDSTFDFSNVKTICDVGCGLPYLLAGVMKKHEHMNGILFDIGGLAQKILPSFEIDSKRISFVTGDFLKDVNVNADMYILSNVHNWSDEQCITTLRNIAKNSQSGEKEIRLLVIRNEANVLSDSKVMDILMLDICGGKERTCEQYDLLFAQSGFMRQDEPTHLIGGLSLIKAVLRPQFTYSVGFT